MEIRQRAQISQIGAKDGGEEMQVMARGTMVAEDEVDPRIEEGIRVVAKDGVAIVDSILWLATSVGYMGIWPATVPPLVVRQCVVVVLAPLVEVHQNPGVQA